MRVKVFLRHMFGPHSTESQGQEATVKGKGTGWGVPPSGCAPCQTQSLYFLCRPMKTKAQYERSIVTFFLLKKNNNYEQLYICQQTQKKLKNSQKHNLLRLNQKEIEKLNRLIPSKEIESVIKIFHQKKKNPEPDGCTSDFYQTFKKEWIPILLRFSPKKVKGILPNSFDKASIILIS